MCKNEMKEIIEKTNKYHDKVLGLFDKYKNSINGSEDYKLLCAYIAMFLRYQEEIMILQKMQKYISALPLTRVAIECYSTIKLLASSYRNDSILGLNNELTKKILAYNDIQEEIKLFLSLTPTEQKSDMGKAYTTGITQDICSIFGKNYLETDLSENVDWKKTKNKLERKLVKELPSKKVPTNGKIITEALKKNRYMKHEDDKNFEKEWFVYIELCKACHNTICSMKDRMEVDIGEHKYVAMDKEHKNNLVYMQINFNCLLDIYDEIQQLFEPNISQN